MNLYHSDTVLYVNIGKKSMNSFAIGLLIIQSYIFSSKKTSHCTDFYIFSLYDYSCQRKLCI